MAIVIVGGLVSSTALTLLVIPALFQLSKPVALAFNPAMAEDEK